MSNGILPAPVTLLQKNRSNPPPKPPSKRANFPRLKVAIRRLPPGLTQAEFEAAIGPEWKIGGGNVDWYVYRTGKVSKDVAKPSKPARAYLHLTDTAHLTRLAEQVRQTEFRDAKNTTRDPTLLGPPSVEFAPSNKIPQRRGRKDARQGTIDQDPEFIAFLESLTNPIQKPPADLEASLPRGEMAKTTPLIEHIREKKAARDKPPTGKATLKQARQEAREASKDRRKGKEAAAASTEKGKRFAKTDRGGKDGGKASSASASQSTEKVASSSAAQPERRRDRAPLNLAAKIQRDLGITPAARRGGKREKSTPETTPSPSTMESSSKEVSSPGTGQPASPVAVGSPRPPRHRDRDRAAKAAAKKTENTKPDQMTTGESSKPKAAAPPTILKKPNAAQQKAPLNAPVAPKASLATPHQAVSSSKGSTEATSSTTPTTSGHRAFLKHANPSQGITEALIQDALSKFGAITHVEIDKRKGFAYVDFAELDSLLAAVKVGKVDVAKGAVQILRDKGLKAAGGARGTGGAASAGGGGRGSFRGRGRGRGGGGGTGSGTGTGLATAAPAPTASPAAS